MIYEEKFDITSPFIAFVDRQALAKDIAEIPARKEASAKLAEKCRKAMDRIAEIYIKEARRRTKDVPAAYCRMTEYIGISRDYSIFVKVPEMVPLVETRGITVDIFDDGTPTLIDFDGVYCDIDGRKDVLVSMMSTKYSQTNPLYTDIKTLKKTESVDFFRRGIKVCFPDRSTANAQRQEIERILDRHLLTAKKEIKDWLGELEQYADPTGLFGAML